MMERSLDSLTACCKDIWKANGLSFSDGRHLETCCTKTYKNSRQYRKYQEILDIPFNTTPIPLQYHCRYHKTTTKDHKHYQKTTYSTEKHTTTPISFECHKIRRNTTLFLTPMFFCNFPLLSKLMWSGVLTEFVIVFRLS